jgi:succinate dehydrogenase / fumarate reductase cytochrome b subunit
VLLQAGLLAAVLFHALNGIRVILIDVWAHGQRRRRAMLAGVGAVWLLLVVPALVVLGVRLFGRSG